MVFSAVCVLLFSEISVVWREKCKQHLMALKIPKVNLNVSNLLQHSVKDKLSKDIAEFQNSRPLVCTVSITAVII